MEGIGKKLEDVLEWNLKYGELIQKIKHRIEAGKPTPTWDQRPILFDDLQYIWEAFSTLDHTRDWTAEGGPRPIKIAEINAYLVHNDVPDIEEFVRSIQFLDKYFIKFTREKNKG